VLVRYVEKEQTYKGSIKDVIISSTDLVAIAIANRSQFKNVAAALEKRQPDASAALLLVSAYREGRAPGWLTAHLLGCIGDEAGYETVRDILLSAPGALAESYAGPALAKIRGARAFEDLCGLLRGAPKQASREGAAYGLGRLASTAAANAIFDATLSALIRYHTVASVLRTLPTDVHRLLELLSRDDPASLRLGSEIVWCAASDPRGTPDWLEESRAELVSALQKVLARADFSMAPRKREWLKSWVAKQRGGATE